MSNFIKRMKTGKERKKNLGVCLDQVFTCKWKKGLQKIEKKKLIRAASSPKQ